MPLMRRNERKHEKRISNRQKNHWRKSSRLLRGGNVGKSFKRLRTGCGNHSCRKRSGSRRRKTADLYGGQPFS